MKHVNLIYWFIYYEYILYCIDSEIIFKELKMLNSVLNYKKKKNSYRLEISGTNWWLYVHI